MQKFKVTDKDGLTVFTADSLADIAHWLDNEEHSDDCRVESAIGLFEPCGVADFPRVRALAIRKASGLTQAAFGQKYRTPKRTIENWEATSAAAGRRTPAYVLDLLERVVDEGLQSVRIGGSDLFLYTWISSEMHAFYRKWCDFFAFPLYHI